MAGATEVLVGSSARFALVHELRGECEPTLGALIRKLSPVDLVLVEGYKREPHPKLEVYRAAVGKPLIQPEDQAIVAIASDVPLTQAASRSSISTMSAASPRFWSATLRRSIVLASLERG